MADTLYRVTCDFPGGGWGITLPFPSADDAIEYGKWRSRAHANAVVTAAPCATIKPISAEEVAEELAADQMFVLGVPV